MQPSSERVKFTTSNIYWSPQARFLIAWPKSSCQCQEKIFTLDQLATTNSTHSHNLFQSKFSLLTVRGRCWKNLSIPVASQENLAPTFLYFNSSFSSFISETKDILDSPCVPISKFNQEHKDKILADPKQDLCPNPSPPNPQHSKHSKLQNNKVRPPVSLSIVFLTEGSLHQNLKANSYFSLLDNDLQPLSWKVDLLTIRPTMYFHCPHAITTNTKYQIPVVKI